MEKNTIIHISDLHISKHKDDDGNLTNVSWIDTSEAPIVDEFIDKFIDAIKLLGNSIDGIIISGDITNEGHKSEFNIASMLIKRMLEDLEVGAEKLLLIPGNHDVNYLDNKIAFQKSREINQDDPRKPFEFFEEKLANYSNFLTVQGKTQFYSPDKAIVDTIQFEDQKIIFLGINTTFKCSYTDGRGYVDIPKLESELVQLLEKRKDYIPIAVVHHNPITDYEKNKDDGFHEDNLYDIKRVLKKYNVSVMLSGHEHTSGGRHEIMSEENEWTYLTLGGLSLKKDPSGFAIIEIENSESHLELARKSIKLNQDGNKNISKFGYWNPVDPKTDPYFNKVILKEHKGEPMLTKELVPGGSIIHNLTSESSDSQQPEPIENDRSPYFERFYTLIKVEGVYRTGHFHWSEKSRAHNWIDVAKLLRNRNIISEAQTAIYESVSRNKIDYDAIIGLGMEGNVLSSLIVNDCKKPYSFLPYSYRYEDHNEFDQALKLNLDPFESVLIITDVVHEGATIINLIEREKESFKHVKVVNTIALIHTGKRDSGFSPVKKVDDKIVKVIIKGKKLIFRYIVKVVVEECPYGDDYRKTCEIFREKLDTVHEFFDCNKSK